MIHRTVFRQNIYHAHGLLARVPFLLTKILRFSAQKVKSANRTVFNIKSVLCVLIDLFQKREPFRDSILKQINSKKALARAVP